MSAPAITINQQIQNLWSANGHVPPSIPLGFYDNQYLFTISDDSTVLLFVVGDNTFAVVRSQCGVTTIPGTDIPIWYITSGYLQVISCRSPNQREAFAYTLPSQVKLQ